MREEAQESSEETRVHRGQEWGGANLRGEGRVDGDNPLGEGLGSLTTPSEVRRVTGAPTGIFDRTPTWFSSGVSGVRFRPTIVPRVPRVPSS